MAGRVWWLAVAGLLAIGCVARAPFERAGPGTAVGWCSEQLREEGLRAYERGFGPSLMYAEYLFRNRLKDCELTDAERAEAEKITTSIRTNLAPVIDLTLSLAREHMVKKEWEQARAQLRKARGLDPRNEEAARLEAEILCKQDWTEEAWGP